MNHHTDILSVESDRGQALVALNEAAVPMLVLAQQFQMQQNVAFCGVATSCCILNASGTTRPESKPHRQFRVFTQENFFRAEIEQYLPRSRVESSGMSIAELGRSLSSHGVETEVKHASQYCLDEFKNDLSVFARNKTYLAVNYFRPVLGQDGGGHISPVGGWVSRDRSHDGRGWLLIMDTATYRLPWVWVTSELLHAAMSEAVEDNATTTRGWVTIAAGPV